MPLEPLLHPFSTTTDFVHSQTYLQRPPSRTLPLPTGRRNSEVAFPYKKLKIGPYYIGHYRQTVVIRRWSLTQVWIWYMFLFFCTFGFVTKHFLRTIFTPSLKQQISDPFFILLGQDKSGPLEPVLYSLKPTKICSFFCFKVMKFLNSRWNAMGFPLFTFQLLA